MNIEKAFMLSAGFGTRFQPQTNTLPKPALPFFNLPLALYPGQLLKKAGVKDIFYNSHHLPDKLEESLKPYFHTEPFYEPEILDSAGGIANASKSLKNSPHFWVVNGDSFITAKDPSVLEEVAQIHQKNQSLATLIGIKKENRGSGLVSNSQGVFQGLSHDEQSLQFIGLYILSSEIFDFIEPKKSHIFLDVLLKDDLKKRVTVFDGSPHFNWYETGNERDYVSCLKKESSILKSTPEKSSVVQTHKEYQSAKKTEEKLERFLKTHVWSNDDYQFSTKADFLNIGDHCTGKFDFLNNCEVASHLNLNITTPIKERVLVDTTHGL